MLRNGSGINRLENRRLAARAHVVGISFGRRQIVIPARCLCKIGQTKIQTSFLFRGVTLRLMLFTQWCIGIIGIMLIQHIADEAICRRRLNPKTARIPHAVQPIPNASDMISYHEFCFPLRYLPIQGIAIHAAIFAIFPDICKKTRQENPLSKPVFLSFLTLLLFLFSSFFLSKN